jgi:hypothetical protein
MKIVPDIIPINDMGSAYPSGQTPTRAFLSEGTGYLQHAQDELHRGHTGDVVQLLFRSKFALFKPDGYKWWVKVPKQHLHTSTQCRH